MSAAPAFVDLLLPQARARIEYQWVGAHDSAAAPIVFLHEGLGSLALWRDFPQQLCAATGRRGLVYSRPGYGQSTATDDTVAWTPDFMQHQADTVLPALLQALQVDTQRQPPWLLGHSDGGSIALLYAATFPTQLAGAVVLAPHILVEPVTLDSIALARDQFGPSGMEQRLARYHAQPGLAFWRWNNIWLHPDFRDWRIDARLPAITCPLLAVQGEDDAYGTLEQIRGIARQAPQCEILALPDCGHSPHRDQAPRLIEAVQTFLQQAH